MGSDQRRRAALAGFQDLELVGRVEGVLHRRGEEVVENEQTGLRELVERLVVAVLGPRDVELPEHVVEASVPNRHELPAGCDSERLGDIAFAAVALGDDRQVLARFHLSSGCESGDAVA